MRSCLSDDCHEYAKEEVDMSITDLALVAIGEERKDQKKRWGNSDKPDGEWLLIFQEELGEAVKACNEGQKDKMTGELIQCLAVGVGWLEAVCNRENE